MRICFGRKLGGSICERTLSVVGTVRWGSLASCAPSPWLLADPWRPGGKEIVSRKAFSWPEFRRRKSNEFYAALPPNKLYGGMKNGQAFYVFKDAKTRVIYVGNEEDYQHYLVRARRSLPPTKQPRRKSRQSFR